MRIVTKQQATAGLAIPGTTSAADLAIKKNRAVRIVRLATKQQESARHVRAGIRWEATVRSAKRKQPPDPIQAAAEAAQAVQHTKQTSEFAARVRLHTQVAFPVTSESRAATALNVQEDCARRAMILPDDT